MLVTTSPEFESDQRFTRLHRSANPCAGWGVQVCGRNRDAANLRACRIQNPAAVLKNGRRTMSQKSERVEDLRETAMFLHHWLELQCGSGSAFCRCRPLVDLRSSVEP